MESPRVGIPDEVTETDETGVVSLCYHEVGQPNDTNTRPLTVRVCLSKWDFILSVSVNDWNDFSETFEFNTNCLKIRVICQTTWTWNKFIHWLTLGTLTRENSGAHCVHSLQRAFASHSLYWKFELNQTLKRSKNSNKSLPRTASGTNSNRFLVSHLVWVIVWVS